MQTLTKRLVVTVALCLVVGLAVYGQRAGAARRGSAHLVPPAESTTKVPRTAAGWARGADDAITAGGLPAIKAAYEGADGASRRTDLLRLAANLGEPGVAQWLAGIAQSDPALAIQASSALGGMSSPAQGANLLEIAKGSATTLVRANAVRALARCGGAQEVGGLTTLLRDVRQPLRVRQEAALALGKIGDSATVPMLIAVIEQSAHETGAEGEQLRISGVQALGELRSSETHAFLERYAQKDLSPTERAFVARADSAH